MEGSQQVHKKITRRLLLWCVLLFSIAPPTLVAQELEGSTTPDSVAWSPRTSLFIEFGGNGLLYSLNFDQRVSDAASIRVGGNYFPIFSGYAVVFVIPTFLVGKGQDKIELGAGSLYGIARDLSEIEVQFTGVIGYRHYNEAYGSIIRVALTPFWTADGIHIWGGISVGWAF